MKSQTNVIRHRCGKGRKKIKRVQNVCKCVWEKQKETKCKQKETMYPILELSHLSPLLNITCKYYYACMNRSRLRIGIEKRGE